MPRPRRASPASSSPNWPDEPCTNERAEKVRLLALRLVETLGTGSQRGAAAKSGVDYSIVSDLIAGRSWPDAETVAALEIGLDTALWPAHESADDAGVEG